MNPKLKHALTRAHDKRVVFLTGAGISAESGIPTFRGQEGYWTVGSVNYHPEEMGTNRAFTQMPDEVWCWYLYRRTVCNRAQPNIAHQLLAKLEEKLGQRFLLVTQNVDGLHLRAGNSLERTYQVHGNTNYMRCWHECSTEQYEIPQAIGDFLREDKLQEHHKALLKCPKCDGPARPHVLWFDECYDEDRFRFHSSLKAALECGVLVSVGSSGSTNLPTQMVRGAAAHGAQVIDINTQRGPYAALAESCGGMWLNGTASSGMQQIAEAFGVSLS